VQPNGRNRHSALSALHLAGLVPRRSRACLPR
jgi:hypothetical protein